MSFQVNDAVKMHWDGPVTAKVVHVEGDNVTVQRCISSDPITMTQEELAALVSK